MKGGRRRALLIVVSAWCAFFGVTAHACKEPTEVIVDIKTFDFKCSALHRITIVVASDPKVAETRAAFPQAEVTQCESDDRVGTLVLTPSGDRGAVVVLASYTDKRCEPPRYEGCIVARRAFSFIDHVPLHLPITLEAQCRDVPCDTLSSCREGQCISSDTKCEDNGTCAAPAEPAHSDDGGVLLPPQDATVDAGPPNDGALVDRGGITPISDSGPDVFDSGIKDATTDVPVKGMSFGNMCPVTYPQPRDCFLTSEGCCAPSTFGAPITCQPVQDGGGPDSGAPWCMGQNFACTGKLHCTAAVDDFCCATGGTLYAPASQCMKLSSGCQQVLCNGDDDCPANLACRGIKFGADAGVIRQCIPPP